MKYGISTKNMNLVSTYKKSDSSHTYQLEGEVSVEEREDLINKVALATGDEKKKYAWQLVKCNYPLVMHVIQKNFSSYDHDKDFMVSDGIIGLYKAVIRIREKTSNQMFACYAAKYIFGHVMKGLKDRKGIVHFPHNRFSERHSEVSIDSMLDVNSDRFEIPSEDLDESVFRESDTDFCDYFMNSVIKYYHDNKKSKYATFFSDGCMEVLDAIAKYNEYEKVCEACGRVKQRVEQIRQDVFVYIVQKLRDGDPQETREFFDVIYNGRYSLNNPPPLSGWRKKLWDRIMNDKDKSFKTSVHYTRRNANSKKKEKVK